MHAFQDSYSHQGYGPILGQGIDYLKLRDPYAPDYTDQDPGKANDMAKETFKHLTSAAQAGEMSTLTDARAISYNAIKSLVDRFNRASDAEQKRKFLREIEKKVTLARQISESPVRTETMRTTTQPQR